MEKIEYRVFKYQDGFGIHGVLVNEKGEVTTVSTEPEFLEGETTEELFSMLEKYVGAFDHGVLKYMDFNREVEVDV